MSQIEFLDRIRRMNETFEIPSNDTPTNLGVDRLRQFRSILAEEITELDDLIEKCEAGLQVEDLMVQLADFLGDIKVYASSEARRWGLPIGQVLHAIMDSQDSKLIDGKPLKDERQKFIKGPNYVPPEDKIREVLFPEVATDVPA